MMFEKTISHLLKHACPSIQYRIRKEILKEDENNKAAKDIQKRIESDPRVKKALSYQQKDGYLGEIFHAGIDFNEINQKGRTGAEGIIRFLNEMGLSPENSHFRNGINALKREDWFREKKGVCWIYYPEYGMYGLDFVRAVTLSSLGIDNDDNFNQHALHALAVLRESSRYSSYEQITSQYNDKGKIKLVFKEGIRFPEIYHLKLLAHTSNWRTKEGYKIAIKAIQNLIDICPIRPVKYLHGKMCLGPATIYPPNLNMHVNELSNSGWGRNSWPDWFHTFELFSRMNIVNSIPDLQRQANELKDLLEMNDGFLDVPLSSRYSMKWSIYTGYALEDCWGPDERRYDLTFRAILILFYCGLLNDSGIKVLARAQ